MSSNGCSDASDLSTQPFGWFDAELGSEDASIRSERTPGLAKVALAQVRGDQHSL
jgi:hypothetical protein